MTAVSDCTVLSLPRIESDRGTLTPVYGRVHVPFDIRRVYYLYDIPGGASRGGHGHIELEQLIVAASGSFRVTVDDGRSRRSFFLSRPDQGLHIKPMIWRELEDFSSGGICMVLASARFSEPDYIRNYDDFLRLKGVDK
jgi:hypothetical protein